MHCTTQNSGQLQTIFGGGYIPEQHGEQTHRYLPLPESREFTVNFDDLLKAFRAALSLR